MDFPVTLDSQSNIPLHRQLYDEIRRAILSGRLARGKRVPSTRALAESLGISRATVTMSYEYLLSEGYLEATTGSGTYVCRQLPDELLRVKTTARNKESRAAGQPSTRKANFKKLSRYGVNLKDREWLAYRGDEPEIQFSFGRPDWAEFPSRQWLQLLNQHFKEGALWQLDCPSKAQGFLPLRQAIASYLARARAVTCSAEQIIIVNGSQQAIDLVCRVIVDRGDAVGIEEPGYIGARKALEAQGAQLVPLKVDASGLTVEPLKDPALAQLKLVYVTPSHQFPTGVVLSLPRRLELLDWAERTGTFIIEDDYDSEYRYKGRPVPALAGLEHHDTVIYMGTFSKVLLPALRLGYLVVPPSLIEVFKRAKWLCDRHSPLLEQMALADFIKGGHLERHTRKMRALYEQRRKTVIDALKASFRDNVSIYGDNAGINVLIRFHNCPADNEVVEHARALGVGIVPTRHFYLGDSPRGEFLLNYGGLTDEEIKEGVKRLEKCIYPD